MLPIERVYSNLLNKKHIFLSASSRILSHSHIQTEKKTPFTTVVDFFIFYKSIPSRRKKKMTDNSESILFWLEQEPVERYSKKERKATKFLIRVQLVMKMFTFLLTHQSPDLYPKSFIK